MRAYDGFSDVLVHEVIDEAHHCLPSPRIAEGYSSWTAKE
jgi:hypothetical protein